VRSFDAAERQGEQKEQERAKNKKKPRDLGFGNNKNGEYISSIRLE
jgi:hypothetical protein